MVLLMPGTRRTMEETELKHRTAEINGLRMHYVEAGRGPPVLLLHGFPETWFAWRHQIPVLARHYRVIAPDLRGYGHTAKSMGVSIPQCGHLPHEEKPDEVNRALLDFLRPWQEANGAARGDGARQLITNA